MLSFVVSAYERPKHLIGCLASLAVQERKDHEVLLCDNAPLPEQKRIAEEWGAAYLDTSMILPQTCYQSPEVILPHVHGEWLCWPSDDSYYVPAFTRIMLETAEVNGYDFVYCDFVRNPSYVVYQARPASCAIDKTTFILKKEWWVKVGGWPPHPSDWRDGALAETLVHAGARHGKPSGVLVVHN